MATSASTSSVTPLLDPELGEQRLKKNAAPKWDPKVVVAVQMSLLANVLLFGAKLYAFIITSSQAVLASLVDSGVDIASQVVVFLCEREMRRVDRRFPIGKTKLQTVGTVVNACIMTVGAVEVIASCVQKLAGGWGSDNPPVPDLNLVIYAILATAIVVKGLLFAFCFTIRKLSDSALVLAEDHRNDVLSNSVAVLTASIAAYVQPNRWWWVDPVGGMLISAYIVYSWLVLARSQVHKIIGIQAPNDVVEALQAIAEDHDEVLKVDAVRAYHFGINYFVEMDVVVPGTATVAESHDIAVKLQMKIEDMNHIERAFVHVDYQARDEPEHKVDWSMADST